MEAAGPPKSSVSGNAPASIFFLMQEEPWWNHYFKRCPRCGGIFWKESHVDEMTQKIMRLFLGGLFA